MVWVAAAGPAMNIALAILAALAFHLVEYLPVTAVQWVAKNLKNALIINVVLASRLQKKIDKLEEEMQRLVGLRVRMLAPPDQQIIADRP